MIPSSYLPKYRAYKCSRGGDPFSSSSIKVKIRCVCVVDGSLYGDCDVPGSCCSMTLMCRCVSARAPPAAR